VVVVVQAVAQFKPQVVQVAVAQEVLHLRLEPLEL
jgi:hypothetical protein